MRKLHLSKDEARLLAAAIGDIKFNYANTLTDTKEESLALISRLSALEDKLAEYGKDKRRIGRTSQNNFSDLLKRLMAQPIKE